MGHALFIFKRQTIGFSGFIVERTLVAARPHFRQFS
jgi:hypothetical protein